jgi:hypothetical protein
MADRAGKPRRFVLILLIALMSTTLWSVGGRFGSLDVMLRNRVAHQLLTEGGLTVASHGSDDVSAMFRDREGTYTSQFGLGQSIFLMPFDALATVATAPFHLEGKKLDAVQGMIVSTLVIGAMLAVNFWLCLLVGHMLGLERFNAYLISFVATFGSGFWQIAKQSQEEANLAALAMLGLYGFWRWQRTKNFKYMYLSAACAALPLVFRPTAVTILIGLAGLYAWEVFVREQFDRVSVVRLISSFGLCTVLAALVVGLYNTYKTGNPLNAGYALSLLGFHGELVSGLVEPLVGFDRGIIWANIWVLPGAGCTVLTWKHLTREIKQLLALALFLMLSSVAIYARWITWAGDDTYGARYQVHMIPLLTIALGAAVFKWFELKVQWLSSSRYRLLAAMLALLLLLLQVPSIAFTVNLEIFQANVSGLAQRSTNGTHTGAIGQIWLRYTNFFAKLSTGEVVRFPVVDPTDLLVLKRAERWRFWPWQAEEFVGSRTTQFLVWIWVALGVVAVFSWVYILLNLDPAEVVSAASKELP